MKRGKHMSKLYLSWFMILLLPLSLFGEVRCNKVYSEFSAIEELYPYNEGLAAFKIRDQWGFVDTSGKIVVEPTYDDVRDFSSGLAAVIIDEKYGFIDKSGSLVIPMQYTSVESFSEGLAVVEVEGKYGYIDATNRLIIPAIYERAQPFMNGVAVVEDEAKRTLLIEKSGKTIKTFDSNVSLDGWNQDFGHYVATVKYPPFLINVDGRRMEFPYEADNNPTYSEGVLIVNKYINNESLYGIMDLNEKWLVEPRFVELEAYSSGLAIATIEDKSETHNRKSGLIDKGGKFVVAPIYDRLERSDQGTYFGHQTSPEEKTDVLDAAGKLLFSTKCGIYPSATEGNWKTYPGCEGDSGIWVMHLGGKPQHLSITEPEISQVGDYLLLSKKKDQEYTEGYDANETFVLLDPHGIVLSSEDSDVQGKYNWVRLITSKGEQANANPYLLPAAIIIKDYEQIAILTQDHKILTQKEWNYESELLDYSYNSSGEALEGPFIMKAGEVWGAVDGQGRWVIQPDFERLTLFRHGLAFATFHDEEVIVDNSGRIIPFPPGRSYRRIAPFLITGMDESENSVLYRVTEGKLEKLSLPSGVILGEHIEQGLITAQIDEKWGLLDTRDGQWTLAPAYSTEPEPLLQGAHLIGWKSKVLVQLEKSSIELKGLISPLGKELIKPQFSDIVIDYQKGELLRTTKGSQNEGLIDINGKEILPNIHDTISYTDHGWYLANRKEEKGLINTRGEWTVAPGPYWFSQLDKRPYSREENNDEKVQHVHVDGMISTKEKPQPMADDQPSYWWFVIEGTYDDKQTVFYGFDWKERLRLEGEATDEFSEGWIVLNTGEKKRGFPTALANSAGKVVGPLPYEEIKPMHNGLFRVKKSIPDKQKKGGDEYKESSVYGFINSSGKVAIPSKFEAADDFSEERAIVLLQGNLGVIDKSGNLLLHSGWHCGEDPILLDGKGKIIWPKNVKPGC
ncbi:MAG: WG repeat-containing protein [Sulfuricurvum sp.]|nr:WG repeat-containing protein [Sulfuricurvum sp.]